VVELGAERWTQTIFVISSRMEQIYATQHRIIQSTSSLESYRRKTEWILRMHNRLWYGSRIE